MKHLTNAMLDRAWHNLERQMNTEALTRKATAQRAAIIITEANIRFYTDAAKAGMPLATKLVHNYEQKLARQKEALQLTELELQLQHDPNQLQLPAEGIQKPKK